MTPTSVTGTEAVRERVEQEGSFCGGELRGSLWAAIWGMSLRQSASFGKSEPGFEFVTCLQPCGLENVTNL